MRAFVAQIVSASLVLLAALSIFAQPPAGPPPLPFDGPPPPLMLLGQKVVQQELKLTREQLQKIDALRARERQALAPRAGVNTADMANKMKEAIKESRKALDDVLKPGQMQRFKEIALQVQGEVTLAETEVAIDLGLSGQQQKRIKAVCEAAAKDRTALVRGKPVNPKEMQNSMEQINKRASEIILEELTSAQRAKWDEMKGKPIKGLILAPPFPGPPAR